MYALVAQLFTTHLKKIAVPFMLCLATGAAHNASATLIDFDDLNPVYSPDSPCWCDNPLTDQYRHQGLLVDGAWVNGSDSHNMMLTSNFASLNFIGDRPTQVSMNVTSQYGDAILFGIYGTSGLLYSNRSSGWFGHEDNSSEDIANELMTFYSDEGITAITIQGFYNMRIGAAIDNLRFTNTYLPEPSTIALFIAGLLSLAWRRRND